MNVFGDPIYRYVKTNEKHIYQEYFEKLLKRVDIDNFTKWSAEQSFNRKRYDKDIDIMGEILDDLEKKYKELNPVVIQVMLFQYIFADSIERERYKKHWISRVMRREKTDFFPSSQSIHDLFTKDDKGKRIKNY